MRNQKSVFISYAHKDGMDFTRRLAFALSMHLSVFWDRQLQAGNFPSQLEKEIKNRDHFLFIMTPYSIASGWCQRELEYARQYNKPVAIARVYAGEGTVDERLTQTHTYADFTDDFDTGFRHLTSLISGHPLSSWEYLSDPAKGDIIEALQEGILPVSVANAAIEWLIVEKLWKSVEEIVDHFQKRKQDAGHSIRISHGIPRTPIGVLTALNDVKDQFSRLRYRKHTELLGIMTMTTANAIEFLNDASSREHRIRCQQAFSIYTQVRGNLVTTTTKVIVKDVALKAEKYLVFDFGEKLRELVTIYARNSRHLY